MHGLINRAIERFVRDTYGRDVWHSVLAPLDCDVQEFEPMLRYPEALTDDLIASISTSLEREREEVLEDLGTYLVSHDKMQAVRRLLRFSGISFVEFLHSLDELPDRARLAVADLSLPDIELREHTKSDFGLMVRPPADWPAGFGYVLLGLLRAMADDYGALVLLEHRGAMNGAELLSVQLLDTAFAEGRDFTLGEELAQ